jgi:opacity protein-like surface antigen
MKKLLLTGVAFAALGLSGQALAQDTYSAKDSDSMLEGAQYNTGEPAHTAYVPQEQMDTSVALTEPAAGEDEWYANFTGPYIGGDIGFTMGSYEVDDTAGPDGDVGIDGMGYGAFVGYGFEQNFTPIFGGYAGIELGYEWSEADGDLDTSSFDKDNEFLLTFRPGVSLKQDILGYGIIGWSRAEFEGDDDSEDLDGLVLGAGAEFDTGTLIKLRTEYSYTNYEDANLETASFEGHESAVKAGLLLRF